jgi:UDP-N-acetylmuramoyl-tripeptide--D-alanyl-D-alanine ligase
MVSNALAAAAVGHCIGVAPVDIKAGLESVEPVKGRLNRLDLKNGVHVIDDTYNANPGSMAAALATLAALKGPNRAVVVAGDMCELGAHSRTEHRRLGALAADCRAARLYATGDFAEDLAAGAMEAGMPAAAITCGGRDLLLEALKLDLRPGDWVLVKGSRAMRMETVVAGLTQWAANQ